MKTCAVKREISWLQAQRSVNAKNVKLVQDFLIIFPTFDHSESRSLMTCGLSDNNCCQKVDHREVYQREIIPDILFKPSKHYIARLS